MADSVAGKSGVKRVNYRKSAFDSYGKIDVDCEKETVVRM